MERRKQICDTCGKEAENLRRDVIDSDYNALTKPPMWNCEECYRKKRSRRLTGIEEEN
jgi:hypothetical protein